MKKSMRIFLLVLTFSTLVVAPSRVAFAEDAATATESSKLLEAGGLGEAIKKGTGLGDASPVDVTIAAIEFILAVLALIGVGLMIFAGFTWMFSGGNEEKVTQAKGILRATLIGLLIVLAAYGITQYVLVQIESATGQGAVGGDASSATTP